MMHPHLLAGLLFIAATILSCDPEASTQDQGAKSSSSSKDNQKEDQLKTLCAQVELIEDDCMLGNEICSVQGSKAYPERKISCGRGVKKYRNFLCHNFENLTKKDFESVVCNPELDGNVNACSNHPKVMTTLCEVGTEYCSIPGSDEFDSKEYQCGQGKTKYENYLCEGFANITQATLDAIVCTREAPSDGNQTPCEALPKVMTKECRVGVEVCLSGVDPAKPQKEFNCGKGVHKYQLYLCEQDSSTSQRELDGVKCTLKAEDPDAETCADYPKFTTRDCRPAETCYHKTDSSFPRKTFNCGHGLISYKNSICADGREVTAEDLKNITCE